MNHETCTGEHFLFPSGLRAVSVVMMHATTLASVSRAHRAGGGQARCLLTDLPPEILEAAVTCLNPCGSSLPRLRRTCKFMRRWPVLQIVGLQREVYFAFFAMKRLGDAVLAPRSLQCPSGAWQRYVCMTVHDAYYGNRHVYALGPMVSRQAVFLPGLKQVKDYDIAVGAYTMKHHDLFAELAPFREGCTRGHLQTKEQLLLHVAEEVEVTSKKGTVAELRLKPTCTCFGECFAPNWKLKFMKREPSVNVGTYALVRIDGFACAHGLVPPDARPCEIVELTPRAERRATIGHVVISEARK